MHVKSTFWEVLFYYLELMNTHQKQYLCLSLISTLVDLDNAVLHRARDNSLEFVRIRHEEAYAVDTHCSHPV